MIDLSQCEFKLPPFDHQARTLQESADLRHFAIFWEQGTGKTKLVIDTATYLYKAGLIDCVVVVAPNGVHRNWIDDEIPIHLPDTVREDSSFFLYRSEKSAALYHEQAARRLIHEPGLTWLCISYNGFMTGPKKTSRKNGTHKWMGGKKYMWEILKRRKCLYVLDESIDIKSPGAKRTKSIVASGHYGHYTRILNGTPIANGPFDIFPQIRFLDPNFWKDRGFPTFTEFKQHFGVWEKGFRRKANGEKQEFEFCTSYRRLDELHDMLQGISSRVLKDDVLDLPPKLYSKRYFEMNSEQQRVYDAIKEDAMAFLDDGGLVTAPLPITQLLRARQILSGYVPTDDPEDEPVHQLGKTNPRLELMLEEAERHAFKGIIWVNFRMDADLLCRGLGSSAVRYDGAVDEQKRAENKHRFKTDRKIQWIVANESAMSRGHTYTEAHTHHYYNNSFNYIDRVQSEDRSHRAGLQHSVTYTDLIGDPVDWKIIQALRKKQAISNKITGDREKDWI